MERQNLLQVGLDRDGAITRRELLQVLTTGVTGLAGAGFLRTLGLHAEELKRQQRHCVLIFLGGAPSQLETFDPKPGTDNGGPTKAISTAIPGVEFAEYWPKLAASMNVLSVIRTIAGKEAAHERGAYHLKTGRRMGPLKAPHFGSIVAHKLGDPQAEIPNFISIGNTESSGFLGVKVAPFVIDKAGNLPANVTAGVPPARVDRRLKMLSQQDSDFDRAGASAIAKEHRSLYERATRMMTSDRLKAFQLDSESDATKAAYGKSGFGQGCLVARRLVESGVPFVEVQRGGWDMHDGLWKKMSSTAADVDQGVARLVADLKDRGLLDRTVVIVVGEFGRTPKISTTGADPGRDHWAKNFNLLVGGGGIKGGVCVGRTSKDGMEIADHPVEVEQFFRTLAKAMTINADEELYTPEGRPIRIVDTAEPVRELLG